MRQWGKNGVNDKFYREELYLIFCNGRRLSLRRLVYFLWIFNKGHKKSEKTSGKKWNWEQTIECLIKMSSLHIIEYPFSSLRDFSVIHNWYSHENWSFLFETSIFQWEWHWSKCLRCYFSIEPNNLANTEPYLFLVDDSWMQWTISRSQKWDNSVLRLFILMSICVSENSRLDHPVSPDHLSRSLILLKVRLSRLSWDGVQKTNDHLMGSQHSSWFLEANFNGDILHSSNLSEVGSCPRRALQSADT